MSTAPAAAPRLVATICSGRPPTANGRRYTSVNDEVRAIARREAAGKPTLTAKARALYDWGWDHMQYDKSVPGFGLGDIPYCLKVGKATAPTTWAFSLAYGDGTPGGPPQEEKGYHCWAEFYAPGAGWVPVDIAEARKHPELKDYFFGGLFGNRILFTRARNALLGRAGRRVEPSLHGRAGDADRGGRLTPPRLRARPCGTAARARRSRARAPYLLRRAGSPAPQRSTGRAP